jgi:5-(carboxyamino)imidazole ribonucleotide synthase
MVNLVGDGSGDHLHGVEKLLADPDVALHLYGKRHAPKGRKMGHFTVLGETPDAAEAKARELRKLLSWGG